jgi:hypothetical protein
MPDCYSKARIDGGTTRLRFAGLPWRLHMIRYSSIVGSYELIGAEWRLDPHLASTGHAHIDADIPVAITILDKVL